MLKCPYLITGWAEEVLKTIADEVQYDSLIGLARRGARRARILAFMLRQEYIPLPCCRQQVHSELQKCLDVRTMEEAKAVEAAMKLAAECIDTQAPIEHEWDIQVGRQSY